MLASRSLNDALRPAASDPGRLTPIVSGPSHATLSRRELEVAELVTGGLSNRKIAEMLVISEATVAVHVKHILSKFDFSTRAQIAAWFARRQSPA